MRYLLAIRVLVLGTAVVGCSDGGAPSGGPDGFSAAEWAQIEKLSPVPPAPADPTNAYADDPRAATLGQQWFFERRFSGPLLEGDDGTNGGLGQVGQEGLVSCASCHMPSAWFTDVRSNPSATSLATGWTGRNTPSCVNNVFYAWYFWDGRKDTQWSQALGPTESAVEMNGDRLRVAHVIFDHYRASYDALFSPGLDPAIGSDAQRFPASGKPGLATWDQMAPADQQRVNEIFANYGKAIAAYERLLVSGDAPFDRYVAGELDAIGPAAKRGLRLFVGKAGCVACHAGPLLSDDKFHVSAVAQVGLHVPAVDRGRADGVPQVLADLFNADGAFSDDPAASKLNGLTVLDSDVGAFRTKGLRTVAETAPYMHAGQLATLADVVAFYDRGGDASGFAGTRDRLLVPLNLSSQEQADLVAFLETLTGAAIPEALQQDTSAP